MTASVAGINYRGGRENISDVQRFVQGSGKAYRVQLRRMV